MQDHWPYVACDRALGVTLGEWLAAQPPQSPMELTGLLCRALQGLAFAHEAGVVHHDLQPFHLIVSPQGQLRVAAFGAVEQAPALAGPTSERGMAVDAAALRAQRDGAQRDVLALGVLLHQLLSGAPVLDEPDIGLVIARMQPQGRDLVRLPWSTPQPVPEGLRAIANRCTATQERQRYHSARTLLRARGLARGRGQGAGRSDRAADRPAAHRWPLAGIAGHHAALARLSLTDNQRTDEMAELLLQDLALCFELLRTVNSAQVRGTQVAGNGPVLTLRRAIALLGVDGVRAAANSLRPWPGPMSEPAAAAMARLINIVRPAGHAAQALRPPGYDAEVVFLVAVLQNLGRLLVQYHFPEESEQIRQLMQPVPPPQPGGTEHPG
ncbi:HDOD domain-containing protein [Piscinibacter aquaticus]|uniref:HDOD domain-containing protein n=1 Tax=Piscinibacter aquaticus TaxID=392597 RepID=A0A5C6U035_9BURK|nr:HDOD domain-containing protein [Piscinibacter aquaticus]